MDKHREQKELFKPVKQWSLLAEEQMGMRLSLEARISFLTLTATILWNRFLTQ